MEAYIRTTYLLLNVIVAIITSVKSYEISIVFPSMTIGRTDIERECPYSAGFPMHSIQLGIGFAFADKTTCSASTGVATDRFGDMDLYEWRPEITTFLRFPYNASRQVESCMNNSTCQTIHLDEWERLTKAHIRWCATCYTQRDGSCPEVITSRQPSYMDHANDLLRSIVDTMFLYANINCTINPEVALAELPFDYDRLNQPMIINVSLDTFQQCAQSYQRVEVLSVNQQAPTIRYRTSNITESQSSHLNEEISKMAATLSSEPINWKISSTSLDVFGGYWWGTGPFSHRNRIPPTSLLVTYRCVDIPATINPLTILPQISQLTNTSSNETKLAPAWQSAGVKDDWMGTKRGRWNTLAIGLATAGAGVLLITVIIAIAFTFQRQRRHRSADIRNTEI